jgi:hypothetical protein
MEDLLVDIEKSCSSGAYYAALFCALAVPDIAGALRAPNGEAKRKSYVAWFDQWVAPRYEGLLTGQQCYVFRCAALHQGRTMHPNLGYLRIVFIAPSSGVASTLHLNVLGDVLNIDLPTFCDDMVTGARMWLQEEAENPVVAANLTKHLRRYPRGIAGCIENVDVLS